MSGSRLKKAPHCRKRVATESGGTTTKGGLIEIDLPKGLLVTAHKIGFKVLQAFATTAPTLALCDVRRFFSKVELRSSKGTLINLDFHQFYDLARFTEASSAPVISVGVAGGASASAEFSVDLHHILHACPSDLVSALSTPELSSLSLVLTPSPDDANGFVGGAGGAVAAYTVKVDQVSLPAMSAIDKTTGKNAQGWGLALHKQLGIGEITGGAAVTNQQLKIKASGKIRHIMLHTHSITAGTLVNTIIDKITFTVPGTEFFVAVDGKDIQDDNVAERAFGQTGVYVLDMGDDLSEYADVRGMTDIVVDIATLATAPASWKIKGCQAFVEGLENYGL